MTDASGVQSRYARWLRFGALSLSLAGSQVIWSLEIAYVNMGHALTPSYGTPYLLTIGLSKEATGLVWLAGPLSGLVMQPVLGSLSDSSTSPYRRRKYMVGCAIIVALSTCLVAFAQPIATLLLDVMGSGLGDWDPKRHTRARSVVQALCVLGFWVLDFAINGLQVIARALILDNAEASDQNEANAWQGRMLHAGNILGYWCGWVDLASWPALAWLGGGQFRKFAMLSLVCMGVCVAVTCATTPEAHGKRLTTTRESISARIAGSVRQVWTVGVSLPVPIRRVCFAQLPATMSWFPFLFYSTTYVVDMAHPKIRHHREVDEKNGSLAMLFFALLSLASGLVLPSLSLAGRVNVSNAESPPQRAYGISLRTLWTCGAVVHAALLLGGTFAVHRQRQAMVLIMLMGVPWSIWMWVPFAMIGEFVRESESGLMPAAYTDEQWPTQRILERQRTSGLDQDAYARGEAALQRSVSGSYIQSIVSRGREVVRQGDGTPEDSVRGGTVLGIHNLAIVIPQFLMALIASLIFRLTRGGDDVAWVLRFGGIMALGSAVLTRFVPLTLSERVGRNAPYALLPDDEEADAMEDEL